MEYLVIALFGVMCFLFVVFAAMRMVGAGQSSSPDTVEYNVSYKGTGTGVGAVRDMVTWDRNRTTPS